MLLTSSSKRKIMLFMAFFVLIAVLHILFFHVDFTVSLSQLLCSSVTILWAVTVPKRVTDKKLRTIIMFIAVCILLQFYFMILRYGFLRQNRTICRYLWYASYIPMIAQPILCFLLSLFIHRSKEEEPLPGFCYFIIAAGILLMLCVLTNDRHFSVMTFPSGVLDDNGQDERGWMFYVIYAYIFTLFAVTYDNIMRKSRKYIERRYRLLPLVPILIGIVYFVLYYFRVALLFLPSHLWQAGDMYAFCVIAALESCIQLGMIPANTGYEIIFSEAFFPAVILDRRGIPVYRTAAAQYPFLSDENIKIQTHDISGGTVAWTVDMTQVRGLNRQLADATAQIETRNAYLAEENRIKKERAELETRNRLYEKISQIVQPQFEQIENLLDDPDGCGDMELAKIAVLNAYIKRRSNMELLAAHERLPSEELTSAVRESLEYISLCGINTAASSIGSSVFPAKMVISAYEQIEMIVENCLDTLTDLAVTIRSEEQKMTIRMMLKADDFVYETNDSLREESEFSRRIMITKDRQDLLVVLTFRENEQLNKETDSAGPVHAQERGEERC